MTWSPLAVSRSSSEGRRLTPEAGSGRAAGATAGLLSPAAHSVIQPPQQAVDQLQVVQDQLAMQKAETQKLSDQIAALTERFDALQQSIANLPAPSTHAAGPASAPQTKSH